MNRYLAILSFHTDQWTSGSLDSAYVFEENDDEAARKVMASYLSENPMQTLDFLCRITGSLVVEEVQSLGASRHLKTAKLSPQRYQEIDFRRLRFDKSTILELHTFDPNKRNERVEAIKRGYQKSRAEKAKVAAIPIPEVGEDIYVPSRGSLSHGVDDIAGGLAKVKSVSKRMSGREEVHFISVQEVPRQFNWEHDLALRQEELKDFFGESRACPDPDYSPTCNEP